MNDKLVHKYVDSWADPFLIVVPNGVLGTLLEIELEIALAGHPILRALCEGWEGSDCPN